jgi:hypothetical protein
VEKVTQGRGQARGRQRDGREQVAAVAVAGHCLGLQRHHHAPAQRPCLPTTQTTRNGPRDAFSPQQAPQQSWVHNAKRARDDKGTTIVELVAVYAPGEWGADRPTSHEWEVDTLWDMVGKSATWAYMTFLPGAGIPKHSKGPRGRGKEGRQQRKKERFGRKEER